MSVEEKLIGVCLRDDGKFSKAKRSGVSLSSFADPVAREIWCALEAADDKGEQPKFGTVIDQLDAMAAEGAITMMVNAPLTQNFDYLTQCVKDEAAKRAAITDMQAAIALMQAHEPGTPFGQTARAVDEVMVSISSRANISASESSHHVGDVLQGWLSELEERIEGKKGTGVPTGFRVLDVVYNSGWHRGAMYALAARPGKGKTTFGVCTAIAAARAGHGVYFATVEMSDRDIVTKLVSNVAHVIGGRYLGASLDADEIDRTVQGVSELAKLPIWTDYTWGGSLEKLFANARRRHRQNPLSLVVVDYIGLCRLRGRFQSYREMMIEISSQLKRFALELNAAVLVLSQLNRESEKAAMPGTDHIADSDSLARDSDGVLCIFTNDADDVFINIAKNRWGKSLAFPCAADLAKNKISQANFNEASYADQ